MRIGELSRKSGVAIETIRYYERQRLLSPPGRTAAGYRSYTPAALERLRFIKQTQGLGFALKEIRDLLKLHAVMETLDMGSLARSSELCAMVELAQARLVEIDGRIAMLTALRGHLDAFIRGLKQRPAPVCPGSMAHAATSAGCPHLLQPPEGPPPAGRTRRARTGRA